MRDDQHYWLRMIFRLTHVPVFAVTCLLYAAHASGVIPFILFLIWEYSYRRRQLQPMRILYHFVQGGSKEKRNVEPKERYILKLKIKLGKKVVPDRYGYYVVLGHGFTMCPFTMIPRNGGREIELNIRHCTFIDKVLGEIAARTPEVCEAELHATGETWYDLGPDFFSVYGPFSSSDYTIANARRVAVLVQSTGSTVSESVIKFQNIRRYWNKVLVFAVGSDLMDYTPETDKRSTLSSLVFENTNVGSFTRNQAKYRWMMNRIEREIFFDGGTRRKPAKIVLKSDHTTFLSRKASNTSDPHHGLSKEERDKMMNQQNCGTSKPLWPNSIHLRNFQMHEPERNDDDIVVIGLQRLGYELAEYVLKNLMLNDFDVIVCSGVWAAHIKKIIENDRFSSDPEVHLERTKLHIELFDD
uniref:Uncharacterized protein n=1 Tax=Lotharella globosa TaxID=91324 RepID=A0A7S3YZH4_9EUKA